MRDFLNEIWDGLSSGVGVIAVKDGDRLRHYFLDSVEVVDEIRAKVAQHVDLYFAPAIFKRGANRRRGDQVECVGAFWMDLDCGPGKDFPDVGDALERLIDFCEQLDLPVPTIISSGSGLHVYWVLSDVLLDPEEWRRYALGLKRTARQMGFPADPARTADVASLMRLPGSFNHKYKPPRPVKIHRICPPVPLSTFERFKVRDDANKGFVLPADYPPVSAHRIAERCAAIRHIRDTRGNVTEPFWYAGLQLLRHTVEAPGICHEWSNGHPEYSEFETDYKLQRLEEQGIGPTLCERFADYCEACQECPFYGKIKSPIVLGRVNEQPAEAQEAEDDDSEEEQQDTTPTEPWMPLPDFIRSRYIISRQGVWVSGDDDEDDVLLFNHPLWISRIGRAWGVDAVATVEWISPAGEHHQADLSLQLLADSKGLQQWFYKYAIIPFGQITGRGPTVARYLKDWAAALVSKSEPENVIVRFGWMGNKFAWGDKVISVDGVTQARVSDVVPSRVRTKPWSTGDPKEWAEAAKVLGKKGYEPYAFAVLTALAAPILKAANVRGAVLSLTGPSGYGKTVSSRFALSAFAPPDFWTLSPQGTMNAKGEYFRIANNLPIVIDDITKGQHKYVGDLVYMAVNGYAKERVSRAGTVRDTEEWALSLLITTNNPLLELSEKLLTEAGRRRILELYTGMPLAPEDAKVLVKAAQEHYGSVAVPYLQMLVKNKAKIAEIIEEISEHIFSRYNIAEQNRFGVWLVAAGMLAHRFLQEAGFELFDLDPVVTYVLNQLVDAVEEIKVVSSVMVEELFSDFLLEHYGELTVKGDHQLGWIRVPKGRNVVGRIDRKPAQLSIPVRIWKEYLQSRDVSWAAFRRWAADRPTIKIQQVRLAPDAAPVRCVVWHAPAGLLLETENAAKESLEEVNDVQG